MTADIKNLHLGRKIRELRERAGQSTEGFAKELDLSSALLEKIEANEISPPIATLLNIAHHCNEELGYFFDTSVEDSAYTLVRKGEATDVKRHLPKGKNPLSYSYKNLASAKLTKRMEPFIVTFTPSEEKIPQVAHDGEEFVYVLKGCVEFKLRDEVVLLNPGDSLYFESSWPHSVKAVGDETAEAVVVLYPYAN